MHADVDFYFTAERGNGVTFFFTAVMQATLQGDVCLKK
jgi:hypothetical protein